MQKFRKLIRITISIVCPVMLFTFFGFYYIGIKSRQDDAREDIERVSEKQQILSQQILKNILLAVSDRNAGDALKRTELRKLLGVFERQQQYLTTHIADAGIGSRDEEAELSGLLAAAAPAHRNILHCANVVLVSNDFNRALLMEINLSESDFLERMGRVSAIARSNQELVENQIYWLNMSILATLAAALLGLGLLVITPIFKRSITDYIALLQAKQEAEAANLALSENKEKYRHLFAANPLPMWLFDPQTFRFLDVNEIACSHYGYSRDEFLSMTVLDIRREEHRPAFMGADHPLNLPPQSYERGIWQHIKKDGTEIDVEIFAHDATFNNTHARMVVINDVTKRRLAEKKLQHSELRLRQAQSIANIGSWELDLAKGFAIFSEEHCKIYGLKASDNKHSIGSWLSYIHPDDVALVSAAIEGDGRSFNDVSLHHRIVRRDGTVRHLNMQRHYELDEGGIPIGLYGVSHDITASREAETLLAQSEANLRTIVDLLPQRIFVKDLRGKFLFVNKSFADLYGMEPRELILASRADELTVLPGDEDFMRDDRQVITEGKKKIVPEEHFVGPFGEEKIFHVTKLPYFWGKLHEQSVLGILNEITEQKKAESERNTLLTDIVRRNESLEQFAYIISHNLRAPVANILALSGLLQAVKEKSEAATILLSLSTSAVKLDEVIRDLNKILQGTHHTSEKKEKVSFTGLYADVSLSMANQLAGVAIAISTDFTAIDEMYCVKSYIYSIFYNLVANSIKYRQPDLPVQMQIKSFREGTAVGLIFTDNGMGMDLDKIGDKVFGLYKRFHNHVEGKGMGLYMVKRHVEILGGRIEISSGINQGTTFRIIFDHQGQG